MEDMARLASLEESVRDSKKFKKILHELLMHINKMLDNPHDYQLRTININILKEGAKFEPFKDYLKYVGFELTEDNIIYPNTAPLNNLRIARGAIERKVNFCFGIGTINKWLKTASSQPTVSRVKMFKTYPLETDNPFLLKIQYLFNNMLEYEDPELLELAREKIPILMLKFMALNRVRERQKEIKAGTTKAQDLSFDIALVMELLAWFKYKFFSWVDKPVCEICAADTNFVGTTTMKLYNEKCRVELFKCPVCPGGARFPRFNHVRTLLRTRRGRCGEWANCFTLLLRSLGYEARYVLDTTDHVWCEIFDFDSNTWLHCDPCEAKLNTPLMYCHGWGKKLSYVIAASRDDLQDVTWRYTVNHKEVLKRRTACSEEALVRSIVALRQSRQQQVSEARRRCLARRLLGELVALMQERTPSDYESHGRVSGSTSWRQERGELGDEEYTFELKEPGEYTIRYYCSVDVYTITRNRTELPAIKGWHRASFRANNVQRKVEEDWRKVYVARTEGQEDGSISWRIAAGAGTRAENLSVRVTAAVFEAGEVCWGTKFDDHRGEEVQLGKIVTNFDREFNSVILTAHLSGGSGDVAWQHAQLFRQSLDSKTPAFEMNVRIERLPS